MMDERKRVNNSHPHPLQAQTAHALPLSKLVGRPGTGSSTQHHRTTQPPPSALVISKIFNILPLYNMYNIRILHI